MFTPDALLATFNSWPTAGMLALQIVCVYAMLLTCLRLFGKTGVFLFMVIVIIAANIQVLKLVQFPFYPQPITLGNVLFSSTFLATDILNEHYGKEAAKKAVWMGFAGYFMLILFVFLGMGFAPLSLEDVGEDLFWAIPMHTHMKALFMPAPAIFAASMISYCISQILDISIYAKIRKATQGRFLWLRNNASTFLSAFVDNAVFNTLAFVIFAATPLEWNTLIFSYIISMMWMRWALALLDTPILYLSRLMRPKEETDPIVNSELAEQTA